MLKAVSSATETSWKTEISLVASLDMILFKKRKTKALIRLRGCADWSAPLLFTSPLRQVFSRRGPFQNYTLLIQVRCQRARIYTLIFISILLKLIRIASLTGWKLKAELVVTTKKRFQCLLRSSTLKIDSFDNTLGLTWR